MATSVSVSPLSADDWEILETNAAFVEMNLLSQVRAVREGMVVCCWVGTTLVRFTVDATTPPAAPAVVLSSATELLVAPKSRGPPRASPREKQQDISARGLKMGEDDKWERISGRLVRLIPPAVVDALELNPPPPAEDGEPLEDDWAFVSPALYDAMIESLGPTGQCTVQHIPMPTEESGERDRDRREDAHDGSPNPNGAGVTNGRDDSSTHRAEIRVRPHPRVPLEHVWLRDKLKDEIAPAGGWPAEGGFELVKFGSPLTGAERKARAKDTREKEKDTERANGGGKDTKEGQLKSVQSISSASPPQAPSAGPPHPARPLAPLAGVDKELASIKDHVIECLLTRRHAKGVAALAPAPGIIVTGLAGSGKTALVQQVARELERDERALTHTIYVDCAPLSEEPWPKLKEKFKEWFDQAWWHAPTLLVLDNLDKVVQAEQEHVDASAVNHIAHLFRLASREPLKCRPIVLLVTAKDVAAVHPLLMTSHVLGHTVKLRGPDKNSRKEVSARSTIR